MRQSWSARALAGFFNQLILLNILLGTLIALTIP
jgi:hypothetical protein